MAKDGGGSGEEGGGGEKGCTSREGGRLGGAWWAWTVDWGAWTVGWGGRLGGEEAVWVGRGCGVRWDGGALVSSPTGGGNVHVEAGAPMRLYAEATPQRGGPSSRYARKDESGGGSPPAPRPHGGVPRWCLASPTWGSVHAAAAKGTSTAVGPQRPHPASRHSSLPRAWQRERSATVATSRGCAGRGTKAPRQNIALGQSVWTSFAFMV